MARQRRLAVLNTDEGEYMKRGNGYELKDLLALMRRLRDPEHGCPWDQQQTFESIAPHVLEESYELVDCIERGDTEALREELGDLLLQVVFLAQLGAEQDWFDFNDIVDVLVAKLVRRHPHVFPGGRLDEGGEVQAKVGESATDAAEVHRQWEAIKADERQEKDLASALDDVPVHLPALSRAAKLQRRAARIGFDWREIRPVQAKVMEELTELEAARNSGDMDAINDEMGDVLFACVNLARHLGVDPETALRASSRKFERRFRVVETELNTMHQAPQEVDQAALDALWQKAKCREG